MCSRVRARFSRWQIRYFCLVLLGLLFLSCRDTGTGPITVPRVDPPPIIPTTTAIGPGGPAYLRGSIRDYGRPTHAVTNVQFYLLSWHDYSDTLVQLFVNSTDGTFLITQLPLDTIDMITIGTTSLPVKLYSIILRSGRNSFFNYEDGSAWRDSTLYPVLRADSISRPGAPLLGFIGYGWAIDLRFRWGVDEDRAMTLSNTFPCDTVRLSGDPFVGLISEILYPSTETSLIYERMCGFCINREIVGVSAALIFVMPKERTSTHQRKEVLQFFRR
jgi:hypothetical protein